MRGLQPTRIDLTDAEQAQLDAFVRPISQWSATELADEIMQRGIVDRISPRHAARLLKKEILNPTGSAIG